AAPLPPSNPPDEVQKVSILKSVLDRLWARTLRSYQSSPTLDQALLSFAAVCDYLYQGHKTYDFLPQYSARALDLKQSLEAFHVRYRDLSDLGRDIHTETVTDPHSTLLKVQFLFKVLGALRQAGD